MIVLHEKYDIGHVIEKLLDQRQLRQGACRVPVIALAVS
jgi:hypothetical protein